MLESLCSRGKGPLPKPEQGYRDSPTALLPGDKEHWEGLEGSVVPTHFGQVPSSDNVLQHPTENSG